MPAAIHRATQRSAVLCLLHASACAEEPDERGPRAEARSLDEALPARGAEGSKSRPVFLMAGQSNMVGNVDTALFTSLLDELGSGVDDDLVDRLLAALQYWYFEVDGGYASYGYSDAMAALEVNELIALRDQGLVAPDLTAPHETVLCSLNEAAIAPLTTNCGNPFGPELMLGHVLGLAGETTSLIKIAEGGTTLLTDWRSPASGDEVGAQYIRLQERIASLTTAPASVHPSCATEACHWAAFIWFQGENDSFDEPNATSYEANLRGLIADVRSEVGSPTLPVIIVQTGAWAQSLPFGAAVATAQQTVVDDDEYAWLIATDDLSGFYHYDPAAQLIIGKRIADVVEEALGCEDPECGTTGGDTTGGDTTDGDTTDGDTTGGEEFGSSNESGGVASGEGTDEASAEGDSLDTPTSASDSDGGAEEADSTSSASGCGCRHRTTPAGWAWLGIAAVAARRRRR